MEDEPPYTIVISSCRETRSGSLAVLRRVIQTALVHHNVRSADIDLAIVDDAEIAHLHEAHLGQTGPTDVLTFDLRDSREADVVQGQIVLSIDTAEREATERGHAVEAETALYAVHGVLHLLGYDDRTEAEAAKMHELEDQLLEAAGIPGVFHREAKREP